MIVFSTIEKLNKYINNQKNIHNKTIGFIPTMGALHAGHLSLIQQSIAHTDITVCSIFVNPVQFNDPADFEKYPVTIEQDIELLLNAKCDVLFLPSVTEMYPEGTRQLPYYDLGNIETLLEGAHRPGHFQGVAIVVHKLLQMVQPDKLFMGQKDYQQCMVIQQLLKRIPELTPISLIVCPTLRQTDGLALSSRNSRLAESDRQGATALYAALNKIKENMVIGDISSLLFTVQEELTKKGFQTDYLTVADADTLEEVTIWNGKQPLVALVAAFWKGVRLIDNLLLTNNTTKNN